MIKIEKELINKAKKFVRENKIKNTKDADKDVLVRDISLNLIKETFENGIYFTSDELYDKNEKKFLEHKGKNYVIHKYRNKKIISYIILDLINHILISFVLKDDYIIIIHAGEPTRREIEKFKQKIKNLKNSTL